MGCKSMVTPPQNKQRNYSKAWMVNDCDLPRWHVYLASLHFAGAEWNPQTFSLTGSRVDGNLFSFHHLTDIQLRRQSGSTHPITAQCVWRNEMAAFVIPPAWAWWWCRWRWIWQGALFPTILEGGFRRMLRLVTFSPLLLGRRGSVARVCAPALLRLTAVHFHISAVKMGLCRVEHLIKVWASDRRLKENGCHQRLSRTERRLGVRFVVGWALSLCLNKQTQIFAHSC